MRKALSDKFGGKLFMHETFTTYDDYWSFYYAESNLNDPTGSTSIMTSRLIDRAAVEDYDKVRSTVEIVSGNPEAVEPNVVLLVFGGQVFKDAADTTSGLHPAWRTSHYALVSAASLPPNPTNKERQAANDQVTHVKGAATKKLAPNTGGYMNEGDRHDPDYARSFYGDFYETHRKREIRTATRPFGPSPSKGLYRGQDPRRLILRVRRTVWHLDGSRACKAYPVTRSVPNQGTGYMCFCLPGQNGPARAATLSAIPKAEPERS